MTSSDSLSRRPGPGRPGYDAQTVLRRAIELFIEQGYDAVSMSDLAKDLGFTRSAVYYHFDNKAQLLELALNEALDNLSTALVAARTEAGATPYERLRHAVRASVRILVEHLPAVTLLLRVRGNSDVEVEALRRRRQIDDALAELVEAAVADGALRDDIPPDLISRLLFGTVNSLVEWVRPDGRYDADFLADSLTTMVFDGLRRVS